MCVYTNDHWIVHLNLVNSTEWYVNHMSLKLFLKAYKD